MSKSSDEGEGCVILLALVALSIGIGCFWGAGAGWLTLGGLLFAIVVVAA